jgi:LacI family transcriptional regulator
VNTHPARRRVLFTVGLGVAETLFRGFARYAREAHWSVYFGAEYLHMSARLHLDGAVIYLPRGDSEQLRWARRQRFPVLDMGMTHPRWSVPKVLLDNPAIGQLGARHLLDRGYRRFAFAWLEPRWPFGARFQAFAAAVRAAGATVELLPALGLTQAESRHAQRRLGALAWAGRSPLAVMAGNDAAAVTLLALCRAEGLLVPEQVAVLGVDSHPVHSELAEVPLSSVDPDFDAWGYEAGRMLDRMLAGRRLPARPALVPPRGVVTRRSTDQIAVDHPGVARALRFILDHHRERIRIAEVARASAMSRRRVQDAFTRHRGHTIHEELTRLRVADAQKALQETIAPIFEIAAACGFGSPERMAKVFRQRLHTTPRAYRRAQAAPPPASARAKRVVRPAGF